MQKENRIKRVLSEEHKRKISIAMKGRILTEEWKNKIGKANKIALKGKKFSLERRLTMNRDKIGIKRHPFSKEWKNNMSKARKGKTLKPRTEITKLRISIANKGRIKSEQECKNTSLSKKGKTRKTKEETRGRVNLYARKRRKTDLNYRLKRNLSTRIFHTLKGNSKSIRTAFLIGCTIDDLKLHIEKKFTRGMKWTNYGKWHIDHILPCKKYDLTDLEQQKTCFHYTNLQPLWAIDNYKKHDKIINGQIKMIF